MARIIGDRYSYLLRRLPVDIHRKIYSFIYDETMVHSWMNNVDITNIIHTICDKKYNGATVMDLCELYKKYDKNDSKMFLWKHSFPRKTDENGSWYDDRITDYYKMGNEFSKMLAIEYGKLTQSKNSIKMIYFYKVLSALIYMYKHPYKTLGSSNTIYKIKL